MRTIAREAAFQITLRNCPRGRGDVGVSVILVKGEFMQSSVYFCRRFLLVTGADVTMKEFSAFLDVRRCMNWAYKIGS